MSGQESICMAVLEFPGPLTGLTVGPANDTGFRVNEGGSYSDRVQGRMADPQSDMLW